jgi:hypothetical protein
MRSIDEIWRLAREDADFAPDEARVYLLPGTKRGDYWAMYFKPGDWLVFDENFPFSDNQLQDADGPRLMTHRVAVYAGVQEPELAGRIEGFIGRDFAPYLHARRDWFHPQNG